MVGWVDINQNEIGEGCSQLYQVPFVAIVRVYCYPILGLESNLEKSGCQLACTFVDLFVRERNILIVAVERIVLRILLSDLPEHLTDSFMHCLLSVTALHMAGSHLLS